MNKNFDGAYSADLADTAYVTESPFTDDEGMHSRSRPSYPKLLRPVSRPHLAVRATYRAAPLFS